MPSNYSLEPVQRSGAHAGRGGEPQHLGDRMLSDGSRYMID
jgi:hypothetical protein